MNFTHISIQPRAFPLNEDFNANMKEADRQERIARAAPELLEALRVIVANASSVQLDPQWAVQVARAAIAKAKE